MARSRSAAGPWSAPARSSVRAAELSCARSAWHVWAFDRVSGRSWDHRSGQWKPALRNRTRFGAVLRALMAPRPANLTARLIEKLGHDAIKGGWLLEGSHVPRTADL